MEPSQLGTLDPTAQQAQAAHRDLVLERVERVRQQGPFNEKELAEAVRRLNERTCAGDWQDDRYLRQALGRFRDMPE